MSRSAPPLDAFASRDDLEAAVARRLHACLADAIAARGAARLAVSGGRSPGPLYARLAGMPLAWERVTIVLVDERWVDLADPGSNESLVRAAFGAGPAAAARIVGLKTPDPSPADAAPALSAMLREIGLPSAAPLDAVVLGLGTDGHTASWFPGADGLAAALSPPDDAPVAAVRALPSPVAGAYLDRITLTRPTIAAAGRLELMLLGPDKADAYAAAARPGPVSEAPVRALLFDPAARLHVAWAA